MTKTPEKIHLPFDACWKAGMQHVLVARDLFEAHLPEQIKKHLDLSTLELKPGTFIDAQHNQTHSDILYGVSTRAGYGYLYILAEQQRKPEKHMLLRLFTYMLRIIELHMKQPDNEH